MVEANALAKIQRHIEDPHKKVRVKGIIRFLVDKGHVTSKQAKKLLDEYERDKKELEAVGSKKGRDTNELIGLESGDVKVVEDLKRGADVNETRLDMDQPVTGPDDIDMDNVVTHEPDVVDYGHQMAGEPMHDPFADPFSHGHHDADAEEPPEEDDPKKKAGFRSKQQKENQWESKWLFIGGGIAGLLIIVGLLLYIVVNRTSAEDLWEEAYDAYERNSWSDAIGKFDRYIENHPNDEKFGDAVCYRALARWRIPYESKRWDDTITVLDEVLPRIVEEEKFSTIRAIREDLAVVLTGTALQISEKALEVESIDEKEKLRDKAFLVNKMVTNPAYVPTSLIRAPANNNTIETYTSNLAKVERQIEGEAEYQTTLATIKEQTAQGKTGAAFEAYYAFINKFIEWKSRKELQTIVEAISDKERDLVKPAPFEVEVEKQDLPSPVKHSVVVATNNTETQTPLLTGQTAAYLINGAIYGIDLAEGKVLWRRFVGFETNIHPQWVNVEERQELIIADSRENEVMRIDGHTGDLIWRTKIGEPFAQPVVTISYVYVTTESGRVIKLMSDDGTTGRTPDGGPGNSAPLPQPANVGVAVNDSDPYVYQVGNYSNIYVLSTDTLECKDVYYTGHDPDTIQIPPVYVSGYLLVATNTADKSRIDVYKVTENGRSIERARTGPPTDEDPNAKRELITAIHFDGQMHSPMLRYNRFVLAVSDSGDLKMIDINATDWEQPITVVAEESFSSNAELMVERAQLFLTASEGQLWIANPGISSFKIRSSQNELDRQSLQWTSSTFLGPSFKYDDSLIVCRRRKDNPMATVSALDPTTLDEKWRLDLGAETAGSPIVEGDRLFVVTSQGDSFPIDAAAIEKKMTVNRETVVSKDVETYVFNNSFALSPTQFAVTGPPSQSDIMLIDRNTRLGFTVSKLKPPADEPSCAAVKFGNSLIVASSKGQVLRIDPGTGNPIGAAFQPPLAPGRKVKWYPPVVIEDGKSFIIADAMGEFYSVVANADVSLSRVGEFTSGNELVSPIVRFKDYVVGVSRQEDGDYLIALPIDGDLEIAKSVKLRSPYYAGPYAVDDKIMVGIDTGEWLAFGNLDAESVDEQTEPATQQDDAAGNEDAQQAEQADTSAEDWAIPIGNERLAASPSLINDQIVLVLRSGKIWFVDPASGNVVSRIDTRQPLATSAMKHNGELVVGGADGTIHFLEIPGP